MHSTHFVRAIYIIACPRSGRVIPRVHLLGLQTQTVFPSEGLVARPRTCRLGSNTNVLEAKRHGSRMPTSPSECFSAETPEWHVPVDAYAVIKNMIVRWFVVCDIGSSGGTTPNLGLGNVP